MKEPYNSNDGVFQSKCGTWKVGDTVLHKDYGLGVVWSVLDLEIVQLRVDFGEHRRYGIWVNEFTKVTKLHKALM